MRQNQEQKKELKDVEQQLSCWWPRKDGQEEVNKSRSILGDEETTSVEATYFS